MFNHILLVRQHDLVGVQLTNRRIVHRVELDHRDDSLTDWILKNKVTSVKLIVDLIEEELYVEESPALYLWERSAFAERQLRRRFPVSTLANYWFSQQVGLPWIQSRGDLRLSGFNDETRLNPIMRCFDAAQVRLTSIHSSMSLFHAWIKKAFLLNHKSLTDFNTQTIALLVQVNDRAVKQFLFVSGQVRVSRTIYLESNEVTERMALLLQELRVVEKFAKAQKMMPLSHEMSLFYLARDQQEAQAFFNYVLNHRSNVSLSRNHVFDIHSQMGALEAFPPSYDQLMINLLVQSRLDSDYLPKAVLKSQHVNQGVNALWLMSGLLLMVFVSYLSHHVNELTMMDQEIVRLSEMNQQYQLKITQLKQANDHKEVEKEDLLKIKNHMNAVDAIRHIQKDRDLSQLLLPLSQVMMEFKDINITHIDVTFPEGEKSASVEVTEPLIAHMTVSLEIQVEPDALLSAKIKQVERLVRAINESDYAISLKAKLVKSPFNVNSEASLRMRLEDRRHHEDISVPFELTIGVIQGES
jgi:hypothetical protein